jgi:ATP-dependent 26S proteasome regulatory subunit
MGLRVSTVYNIYMGCCLCLSGTGKTLLARACAAQTKACYLKLAGPSLVQMFIGDGAKLVRDAFELAKEKAPSIIFIDELDAIGTKRFDSEKSGDREVQRTMLELLNQLDGFGSDERIKVRWFALCILVTPEYNISRVGYCCNKQN